MDEKPDEREDAEWRLEQDYLAEQAERRDRYADPDWDVQ